MSDNFVYDVFISYSHRDKDWVRGELLPRLEREKIRVCVDFRDFEPGAPSVLEMERAVKESRKTLLVLTPAYLESEWTEFESILLQTLDPANRKRRLIPLLKERCELPLRINAFTHVDLTEDEDTSWSRLIAALKPPAPQRKKKSRPTRDDWLLVHPYPMPPNFTGRAAERQMLSSWLEGNGPPLFVLRALGGFGKSALVWHWLLHDVDPGRWPRVLWWSFYETEAKFERFLLSTLAYLGIDPKPLGPRDQVDALLLTALRQPGVLLVLDGFERELRAFASLGASYQGDEGAAAPGEDDRDCVSYLAEVFLRGVAGQPGIHGRVLVTTRLRPRTIETRAGELLLGCQEEELTTLQPEDTDAFFHAEGIRGTQAEIEAACAYYGYHPLSLRLLAGLVLRDPRSPGDIAAAHRLDVTGDLVQRRHHVLKQSYESLSRSERRLLSRIACFRGTVSYEAITAAGGTSPDELDRLLRDLIARGLLHHDPCKGGYDLHPIVRRYAYDRLGQEEQQTAHRTLCDYFAAVPTLERVQTLDDLEPIVELYHHTVRAGEYDAAEELFGNRLEEATYYQFGAYDLRIQLLRALFPDGENHPPRLSNEHSQPGTLNALGNSYSLVGQPRRAVTLFELSNKISENLGQKRNLAVSLGNLAHMAELPIGDLKSAEVNLRRSISICGEIESVRNKAFGHSELGRVLSYRGNWTDAKEELDLALKVLEWWGHEQLQGVAWAHRALCHLLLLRSESFDQDSRSQALDAASRALAFAGETARNPDFVYPIRDYVRAHWLLGAASRETSDKSAADKHLSEALARCRRINLIEAEADILLDFARLRLVTGDRPEALRLAKEALAITERCGYVLQGADVHLLLARLDLEKGDEAEARRHAAEARRLATCDGPPDYTYKVAYDEAGALLKRLGKR